MMGPLKHPLQTETDQQMDRAGKLCACGAVISLRAKQCKRCKKRIEWARYRNSEKGKETLAGYRRSEKRKESQARYRNSEKGKAVCRAITNRYRATMKGKEAMARYRKSDKGMTVRARRIRIGDTYCFQAQTVEQAMLIRNHIKERTREFISRQQARAQAEGAASGAVSTQTEPRTD